MAITRTGPERVTPIARPGTSSIDVDAGGVSIGSSSRGKTNFSTQPSMALGRDIISEIFQIGGAAEMANQEFLSILQGPEFSLGFEMGSQFGGVVSESSGSATRETRATEQRKDKSKQDTAEQTQGGAEGQTDTGDRILEFLKQEVFVPLGFGDIIAEFERFEDANLGVLDLLAGATPEDPRSFLDRLIEQMSSNEPSQMGGSVTKGKDKDLRNRAQFQRGR